MTKAIIAITLTTLLQNSAFAAAPEQLLLDIKASAKSALIEKEKNETKNYFRSLEILSRSAELQGVRKKLNELVNLKEDSLYPLVEMMVKDAAVPLQDLFVAELQKKGYSDAEVSYLSDFGDASVVVERDNKIMIQTPASKAYFVICQKGTDVKAAIEKARAEKNIDDFGRYNCAQVFVDWSPESEEGVTFR